MAIWNCAFCFACAEPTAVWQQCLDDDTQCYYYWNYETNEVTWEIPAEFSQYLLQYQEYEHALASYEHRYSEWRKARHRRRYVGLQVPLDVHFEPIDLYPLLTTLPSIEVGPAALA